MLLVFLSILTISCTASPFHKYPFVFLLDIGNEELGKASTEQIKVSVPGGAIAVKYPATGQGDIIGHVRVTGIDYGTDLKANIVEGGPGYRYIVLVFMGNAGVEYDAVVTIQTLSDEDIDVKQTMDSEGYEVKEDEDANDSAEETDDSPQSNSVYSEKMNAEITQSSSNVYRYVKNENLEVESQENVSNENENDDDDDDEDDGVEVNDNVNENKEQSIGSLDAEDGDVEIDQNAIQPKDSSEQLDNNENQEEIDDVGEKVNTLKSSYLYVVSNPPNINNREELEDNAIPNSQVTYKLVMGGPERFYALRPRFYGDVRAYPQIPVPEDRSYIDHSEDDDNRIQGQSQDTNNNINDYISPVEY